MRGYLAQQSPVWRFAMLVLCTASVASCSGSKSPTAPTPVSTPLPSATPLVCPSNIEKASPDGGPLVVGYAAPALDTNGTAINAVCQPGPGTTFPVGETQVVCVRPESVGARCSFSVFVREPPTLPAPPPTAPLLSVTRIMAFGDSITEGVLVSAFPRSHGLTSYPTQLQAMLSAKYPEQTIEVINEGKAGEKTEEGADRISSSLRQHNPDVVLLLEGINGLRADPETTVFRVFPDQVGDELQQIAREALDFGADVIIATLLPITGKQVEGVPGQSEAIDDVNRSIRRIASRLDIDPVVDLFALFERNLSLLGGDGLHPTIEGYEAIAEAWRRALVSRYEIQSVDLEDEMDAVAEDDDLLLPELASPLPLP